MTRASARPVRKTKRGRSSKSNVLFREGGWLTGRFRFRKIIDQIAAAAAAQHDINYVADWTQSDLFI
jgi:hypothetical protein